MTTVRILTVLTARAARLGDTDKKSGIAKRRRFGPVRVGVLGLADDEQGDTAHHGGPEKAIHHYPYDHYAPWSAEVVPPRALLASPGAFGENISTLGIREQDVCLGDVYQLGSAIVQVSQGRQPCWRLNFRFGRTNMARDMQASGRTGWYYRVRQVGFVAEGDELVLVARPCPAWPLSSVIELLYRDTLNLDRLCSFLDSPYCPPSWRKLVERRITTGAVENWQSRLTGAAG